MAQRAFEVLLIVLCSTSLFAQAGIPASEPQRPAYADRRFDEDWSVLRGADLSGHVWDRVKFIPLTDGEDVWLTVGGQVRARQEGLRQFQFGESQPAQSDAFLLSRIRLSADLHASRYFRIFAEAKSSLATPRELSGGDSAAFVDTIDLQNAFADFVIPLGRAATLTLRGGRQEVLFGAQRLVGPSDWTNVRRTFDGVSGIVRWRNWNLTPFWTELVVVRQHAFDKASPDNKLYGVYASGAAPATSTLIGTRTATDRRRTSVAREQPSPRGLRHRGRRPVRHAGWRPGPRVDVHGEQRVHVRGALQAAPVCERGLRERRWGTRGPGRHVQPTLSHQSLVPRRHRLRRPTEHPQSKRRRQPAAGLEALRFVDALRLLARQRSRRPL
jgi:hypothetical protein